MTNVSITPAVVALDVSLHAERGAAISWCPFAYGRPEGGVAEMIRTEHITLCELTHLSATYRMIRANLKNQKKVTKSSDMMQKKEIMKRFF